MNRLNPFYMFRGLWKSLSRFESENILPSVFIRLVVFAFPLALGIYMQITKACLADPGSILAVLGLLAGALLAAFSQLSSWRSVLSARADLSEKRDRDHLDETAAQLLVASYMSATAAGFLVLGTNVTASPTGALGTPWSAIVGALGAHVLVVFLIAVPRLYSAYVNLNAVRDELNGYTSKKSKKPDSDDGL